MQRELDDLRGQMKASERANDDCRRQTQSSRDQAAVYRTENVRLQDELRSCKSRLNSALDSQEELLRKNSSLHSQIHEVQNSEAALQDELTSKAGLLKHFQDQNGALEADIRAIEAHGRNVEQQLDAELVKMTSTLSELRNEVAIRNATNEALLAKCDSMQDQIREKNADILQRDTELAAAVRERTEVKEELQASANRLATVQGAQDELRIVMERTQEEVRDREQDVAAMKTVQIELHTKLADKESGVRQLDSEVARLRIVAAEIDSLRSSETRLSLELAQRSAAVDKLELENSVLTGKAVEAEALRIEHLKLAEERSIMNEQLARKDKQALDLQLETECQREKLATQITVADKLAHENQDLHMERQLHRKQLGAGYAAASTAVRVASYDSARPYKRDPLSAYYALRAERETRIRARSHPTRGYRRW